MAIRIDYVVKETGQNLRRNFLLVFATIMVVAISLSLVCAAMLSRYAVQNAFVKWNNDVTFIVYMNPTADDGQIAGVRSDLDSNPQVESADYLDRDGTYALFKKIFESEEPDLAGSLKPEELPTSFRVKPSNPDANIVRELASTFKAKAGVFRVEFPDEQVRQVQSAADKINLVLFTIAIILLSSSAVLIFVAIQMAVFARRREVEVMRLVGATNWFIRIPFLLEGVIQGVAGGLLACIVMKTVDAAFLNGQDFSRGSLLSKFSYTAWELNSTLGAILLIGAAVGALSSAISVSFYLKG